MRSALAGVLLLGVWLTPGLHAQQPVDSTRHHGDTLTRPPIQLQPVTVTASPAKRDEPVSATHVTAAELGQAPAASAYDLLRQTAGVEVHEQGQGPGFASDASVRGFSSDHSTDLALWVDGVPINEPVNGHAEGYNDWSLLFPDAIQDVDVIKGPSSALYGNFAMAGVVNVRTLERFQGTTIWVEPGSYGRVAGGLLAGSGQGQNSAVFGLRGVREDGWRPRSAYDLGQMHGRLVREIAPSSTLDLGVELYGTRWDSPGFLTDSQFQAGLYDHVANQTEGGFKRRAQERASLRVLVGPSALWRTTLYATQGRWQQFLTIPGEPGAGEGTGSQTEEDDLRYGFGLTSALTWALPHGELTLGTEGRWDHSDYENWFTTDRARDSAQILVGARQASAALFIQSTTDVTHHVRALIGGRIDGLNTRSDPEGGASIGHGRAVFAPKLGLLYHLLVPIDLYANVSRGFRETDGVIEDPTLPFITAWAYETGLKYDGRYGSAGVALFRMDVSNEQTFDPVTLTSTNGGASRRQGVELQVDLHVSAAISLSGDWTLNDARYRHFITEDGDTLNDARVFNTARYVGTVGVQLAPHGSGWQLRVSSNVVGPYTPFDEPGVELPAYGLVHLSGSVRFGPSRAAVIQFGVRNLFDEAYRELAAGGFVSPGQPRTLYGSVRYGF